MQLRALYRPAKRLFRRLHGIVSGSQVFYLLACDLCEPLPDEQIPFDVEVGWVQSSADSDYPDMLALHAQQDLSEQWCAKTIEGNSVVVAGISEGHAPAASAWLVHNEFPIDEIGHHFRPGPRQAYFCADYVCPRFRGRGLQRLLIRHRLHRAAEAGDRWACAIVAAANAISMQNYLAEGFRPAARLSYLPILPFGLLSVRRLSPRLPTVRLTCDGLTFSDSFHVHWAGE